MLPPPSLKLYTSTAAPINKPLRTVATSATPTADTRGTPRSPNDVDELAWFVLPAFEAESVVVLIGTWI